MNTSRTSLIVSHTPSLVIGKDGGLPWDKLPGDLPRFKELTMDGVVIMGQVTWLSLPRKPLPGRFNFVLTDDVRRDKENDEFAQAWLFGSIDEALKQARQKSQKIFFMGGASIYQQVIDHSIVDEMFISVTHKEFQGDAHFPRVNYDEWRQVGSWDYEQHTQYLWHRI